MLTLLYMVPIGYLLGNGVNFGVSFLKILLILGSYFHTKIAHPRHRPIKVTCIILIELYFDNVRNMARAERTKKKMATGEKYSDEEFSSTQVRFMINMQHVHC